METVKIERVEGKMSRTNKVFYQIYFADGRKATTFDNSVKDLGGATVLAEFVQKGDFLNVRIIKVEGRGNPAAAASPVPLETARTNPVFAFLGACALASPMVLDKLNSGSNVEDTVETVKANFAPFMQMARELLDANLKLEEYAETAEKVMD